ncbi:MAG: site-specific DNA-methyltransferase [Thermoguttaceae bacterium]|jgi:adenine-specific DNA-methyltransferase
MDKITTADPETKSPDLVAENIEQLKALFPEAVTEGQIDFEVLKQLLGGALDEREEKYGLNWNGKRRARQIALTPSTGTLRPCPEESVDWDTTQNLMIEGDNLEALKLLQKSYAGKVKMIYVDPPYNTGKDFVYPDNFQDNIRNYLELTGQVDTEGRSISSNTEASGRFHTSWLNMMYPRLKLARSLLREDGVIFISIDSNEIAGLRMICNEIFGEECFVMDLIWRKRDGAPNDRTIGSVHDYILVYGKTVSSTSTRSMAEDALNLMPRTEKADAEYQVFREPDGPDSRGPFRKIDTTANAKGGRNVPSLHFGVLNPYTQQMVYPRDGTCWRHSEVEMKRLQEEKRLYWGVNGTATTPMRKLFVSEAKQGMSTPSILPDMPLNQHAARELEILFGRKSVFDTPKPVGLLRLLTHIGSNPDDLVMDFFAGSGSLAEAVMSLNSEDGGTRRYILVQLPEPLDPDNKDVEIAVNFCREIGKPCNIAEIAKERLRRAGKNIHQEKPMFAGDLGFRVFKLASSNIRAWAPDRDNLATTLQEHAEHLRANRTESDILFELLLKLGLDLTVPIEQKCIAGKTVHSIGAGVLLVCLAERITTTEVEPLALGIAAWHKELSPAGESQVVFRDSAFSDDVAKTNLTAILQQNGLENVRSL